MTDQELERTSKTRKEEFNKIGKFFQKTTSEGKLRQKRGHKARGGE